jgi:hypothetical protein
MIRTLTTLACLLALTLGAAAECGPTNPNCIVPTAPPGTSNNQAASTAFVQNAAGGGRIKLTGPLNLYSNFGTGVDTNDCLTPATACHAAQGALNKVLTTYDTAGQTVTIHVAVNDTACLTVNYAWVGGGQIYIVGPGGPGVQPSVGFNCGSVGHGLAINAVLPANLVLQNIAISSAAGYMSIYHVGLGTVLLDNVAFNTAGQVHLYSLGNGARIACVQPTTITIASQANYWALAEAGASVSCPNTNFVFLGTQTYAILAYAIDTSTILVSTTKFCSDYAGTHCTPADLCNPLPSCSTSGIRGQKYLSQTNAVIDTETANINFLPGSSAGALTLGGQYN